MLLSFNSEEAIKFADATSSCMHSAQIKGIFNRWPSDEAVSYLPLLPPAAMPRRAAAGAGGGAEFGAGLTRIGRLEDFAAAARIVERGFARAGAVRAIGQGLGAVHFVEMGFVDAGRGAVVVEGVPPTLRASSARPRERASLVSTPSRGG